jgi:hypothetical protein
VKDKLYSKVYTRAYYDNEMGNIPAIPWGQVVRQTSRSIWIQGQFKTEKWTIQANGMWRDSVHGLRENFDFELDPLVKFVFSKH